MEKRGMSRTSFWIFVIIVFAVIFFAIIFFLSVSDKFQSTQYIISSDALFQGVELSINENSVLLVDYLGTNRSIFLNDISEDKIVGSFSSREFILRDLDSEEIDLDRDGNPDILLSLSKKDGKWVLGISSLDVFICEEDWICSDWSPCIEGKIKRVCVDNNLCGTFEDEPETEISC